MYYYRLMSPTYVENAKKALRELKVPFATRKQGSWTYFRIHEDHVDLLPKDNGEGFIPVDTDAGFGVYRDGMEDAEIYTEDTK